MSINGFQDTAIVHPEEISHLQVNAREKFNLINESNADKIFSLYANFFEKFSKENSKIIDHLAWMKNDFSSKDCCDFAWRKLDIHIPINEMEKTLDKTGILQLRPISKDCKVLVVGCGNLPIANAGGDPISYEDENYQKRHAHINAITINPHLAANSTLVAIFGAQKFPMIESGQFDLIVIEGTTICDTPVGREELERLRSPHGQIVSNNGENVGYEFTWEDNGANCRSDDYVPTKVVIKDMNACGEAFNYAGST